MLQYLHAAVVTLREQKLPKDKIIENFHAWLRYLQDAKKQLDTLSSQTIKSDNDVKRSTHQVATRQYRFRVRRRKFKKLNKFDKLIISGR